MRFEFDENQTMADPELLMEVSFARISSKEGMFESDLDAGGARANR